MNDEQVMHAMSIDDSYRVERVLASGAGGTTELVTLDGSGPFVRKRIPSRLARRGVWATLPECGCARLPRVEATYEMPDEFVVVCDFVPGENLQQLVAARGRVGADEAVTIVVQLCEAVGSLHEHGIIHRDISPTNVIVAADGAHLIDFGIARFRVEGATRDTTQLGTYGFASPEQYGFAQTDARSDVYSLGRLLGYLLTGTLPEEAERYEGLLSDDAVVGARMRAVICRASAMEPSHRFQSAGELAAALRGEDVAEPGQEPRARADVRPARRSPRRWVGVVVALAAVSVLVAVALLASGVVGGGGDAESSGGGLPVAQTTDLTDGSGDGGSAPGGAPAASGAQGVAADVADLEGALEIVESGWSVSSQGYVHYAIGLRNNSDALISLPGFTVTGRDEDGSVVFSSDQYLGSVPAGETTYFGSQAGNGTAPAAVEFKVIGLRDYQVGGGPASSFEVVDAREARGGTGVTAFTGEVKTVSEGDDGLDMGGVAVTVVLRDDEGGIVYGDTGFVSAANVGETTSFEVSCYDVPEHASFEVYAQPW